MKFRTYQAYTMAEALAAVKRDLGTDAVILNTRSFVRRTLLGLRRRMIVEVTATPADEARPRRAAAPTRRMPASPNHAAAKRAYTSAAGEKPTAAQSTDGHIVTDEDRERTRRLAMAMAAQFDRKEHAAAKAVDAQAQAAQPTPAPPAPQTAAAPAPPARNEPDETPSRRFVLVPSDENGHARHVAASVGAAPPAAPPHHADAQPAMPHSAGGDSMNDELAAIKAMVGQVLAQQSRSGSKAAPALPANLFEHYLNLVAQDISEELAEQIVNEVRDALSGDELEDAARVREAVAQRLASLIPCSAEPVPAHSPDTRPLTIALVGPTGVGKTTTLAKLAATFKLQHRKKVGLITSDTYRIAAVDQLRTYANIIGLPLHVALTPAQMQRAVDQLSGCDVILVDTAGRSQNDELRIDELRQFIDASGAHEVHLVLSSTASEKVLLREAEAFSRVGVHKIVLTKLDEAVSFGMLINVMRTVGKELSFVTTGQEVPDHIEAGRPHKLADLILGGTLRS